MDPIQDAFAQPEGSTETFLPRLIDTIAKNDPGRHWFITPFYDEAKQLRSRTITFREFNCAINEACGWLDDILGSDQEERETVALLSGSDFLFAVILVALIKTNRRPLLLSLRNSPDAQQNLVTLTRATCCLYTDDAQVNLKSFNKKDSEGYNYIHEERIPEFDHFLNGSTGHTQYETRGNFTQHEKVLIIHTSGSTGFPKPIYITNAWLAQPGHHKYMDMPPDRKARSDGWMGHSGKDKPMLIASPFYHTMGVLAILRSIYTGPLVGLPSGIVPTAELLNEIILKARPQVAIGIFAPSILEGMVETETGLEALGTLVDAYVGGAPLAKKTGDIVIEVTRLNSIIGSTEFGLVPAFEPKDKGDWEYSEWHGSSGVVMEPIERPNKKNPHPLHEMVIKPTKDPRHVAVFSVFPGEKEWRTRDLWEEHRDPSKKGLWKYMGRVDDVIVLNNGEKVNPVSFEKTVEGNGMVKGALVVGQGYFQPALIIELDWEKLGDEPDLVRVLDDVWETVAAANLAAPAHGQIWKDKIGFAPQDIGFVRLPKGSIVRRKTTEQYKHLIDGLYANESSDERLGKLSPGSDLATVHEFVRKAVLLKVPTFMEKQDDDADFFNELGVDSLKAMELSQSLNVAIKAASDAVVAKVLPGHIYGNPSVTKLASSIFGLLSEGNMKTDKSTKTRDQIIDEMVERYTENLTPPGQTVVLTGSTGALGSYILETLIADESVVGIYCLNRSDKARDRQVQRFTERNLDVDLKKVKFLTADFSEERFGLAPAEYHRLTESVTLFIHNAWAVDFNMTLQSYESTHVAGTRRVVDFALQSRFRSHIAFISSIASVGNWPATGGKGAVPEALFTNNSVTLPQGYGESKHVSGRILAVAAEQCGVPVSIIRCGQLAGPTQEQGVWKRDEWLPSLVKTSKSIARLPNTLGNLVEVDWVPIDVAARTVVECCLTRLSTPDSRLLNVFHVVNPCVVPWSELVPAIESYCKSRGDELTTVSYEEWMAALRKESPMDPTETDMERMPAIKLIDFFEGLAKGEILPRMETVYTREFSESLRNLKAVNAELFGIWLKQWDF